MAIRISPSEWEVLHVVWDQTSATAAQIFGRLPAHKNWHFKTVNTFLARLVEKGVLRAEKQGRGNVYVPLLTREECVRQESRSFLDRVFGGAPGPLMAHFVEHESLTHEEIEDLKRLLARCEKKEKTK